MNQWLHTNDILSCTACCFWGTVFSHWWGHLKLGHRFHAPTKVCSDHCPFKPCICIICRHRLAVWSIRIRCWTRVARGSNRHLTRTRDSRRILWTSWHLWGLKTSASGSFPSCTIAIDLAILAGFMWTFQLISLCLCYEISDLFWFRFICVYSRMDHSRDL